MGGQEGILDQRPVEFLFVFELKWTRGAEPRQEAPAKRAPNWSPLEESPKEEPLRERARYSCEGNVNVKTCKPKDSGNDETLTIPENCSGIFPPNSVL